MPKTTTPQAGTATRREAYAILMEQVDVIGRLLVQARSSLHPLTLDTEEVTALQQARSALCNAAVAMEQAAQKRGWEE